MQAERNRQFQAELEGLTLFQQYKLISKRLTQYMKLYRIREYQRHTITFTIDMDDMTDGVPAIKPFPSLSHVRTLIKPIYFKFQVLKDGEKIPLGEIQLG